MWLVAERVWFESTTGPRLAGLLDYPEGRLRGWGVFAHGFTLGKDSPAASRICKQLAREGIWMLRFDNLGLGDSEGDWGDGSFSIKDLSRSAAAQRGGPRRDRRYREGLGVESGGVSGRCMMCRPTKPWREWSNASGTVARMLKPKERHSATAAWLVSTTALNCMARLPMSRANSSTCFPMHARPRGLARREPP